MGKAFDISRGLLTSAEAPASRATLASSSGTEQREQWTTTSREELMTPAPGTLCGPPDWGIDDSVLEARSRGVAPSRNAKSGKAAKKRGAAKKSTAKPAAIKEAATKKAATKKTIAKKTTAKKTTAKKALTKKSVTAKKATKKAAAGKRR